MTAPRRHAAGDGSFARSAGDAATRGALLIGLAVVIGLLLLWKGFDGNGNAVASNGDGGADATADGSGDDSTTGTETDGSTEGGDDSSGGDGTETDGDAGDGSTDGDADDGSTDGDTGDDSTIEVDCSAVGGDILHAPNQVAVITANGSGVQGAAGQLANELAAANYVANPKNTPSPTPTSRILYRPCFGQDAASISQEFFESSVSLELLSGDPPVDPGGDQAIIDDAQIFIIMGSDGLAAAG